MDSDTTTPESTDVIRLFEHALEELVLDSFIDGIPLEDTWDIIVPIADAPNWTVTIEKTYADESDSYRPSVLEE